jgi:hypothetical protein
VLGLDDYADAAGSQLAFEPVGHLRGKPFLDLEVVGEEVDHPAELRQPDDPLSGQVGDLGDAVEGRM